MHYTIISHYTNGTIRAITWHKKYTNTKRNFSKLSVDEMRKFKKNFWRQKSFSLTNYARKYGIDARTVNFNN